jgi:hypothetical protein
MRSHTAMKHFHRRVAGTGAQAGGGRVDAVAPASMAAIAVGHAHGQVVVAVEAEFGLGLQRGAHRGQARLDVVGQQVAGRVGDVDAVGAVALPSAWPA